MFGEILCFIMAVINWITYSILSSILLILFLSFISLLAPTHHFFEKSPSLSIQFIFLMTIHFSPSNKVVHDTIAIMMFLNIYVSA